MLDVFLCDRSFVLYFLTPWQDLAEVVRSGEVLGVANTEEKVRCTTYELLVVCQELEKSCGS